MKIFKAAGFFFGLIFLLSSCQKSIDDQGIIPPVVPPTEPPIAAVDSSCKISKIEVRYEPGGETQTLNFITDENGNPARFFEAYSDGTEVDWKIKMNGRRMEFVDGQWMDFDDSGRIVKSYTSYTIWDVSLSLARIFKDYRYDGNGYLTHVSQTAAPDPNVWPGGYDSETTNTWENGNLVRSEDVIDSANKSTIDLSYDLSVEANCFYWVMQNDVVNTFQFFTNPGRASKNLLTGFHYKWIENGGITYESTVRYSEFKYDAKGNVVSCKVNNVNSDEELNSTMKISYRCF